MHRGGPRVDARKEQALTRGAEAEERSPEDQLTRLNKRYGSNAGAAKERAKLEHRIHEAFQDSFFPEQEGSTEASPRKTKLRKKDRKEAAQ